MSPRQSTVSQLPPHRQADIRRRIAAGETNAQIHSAHRTQVSLPAVARFAARVRRATRNHQASAERLTHTLQRCQATGIQLSQAVQAELLQIIDETVRATGRTRLSKDLGLLSLAHLAMYMNKLHTSERQVALQEAELSHKEAKLQRVIDLTKPANTDPKEFREALQNIFGLTTDDLCARCRANIGEAPTCPSCGYTNTCPNCQRGPVSPQTDCYRCGWRATPALPSAPAPDPTVP